MKEKKWIAFNQESPNEKHEISLDNMDIKNGIRFCCTLYDPKDYVHVKRFQMFSKLELQEIEIKENEFQLTSDNSQQTSGDPRHTNNETRNQKKDGACQMF